MAGADDGYFPKAETRKNPVFGNGSRSSPYFEDDGPVAGGSGVDASRQLDLDDDVRLPWLEGNDEDFPPRRSGVSQGLLLGGLGLAALAVIGGGVAWALMSRPEQPLVADGGVITAPKEPYKVRPENPGGEFVAGTGDTSFAVAEGQSRPVQIDKSHEALAAVQPAAPADAAQAEAGAAGAVAGVGVQVGAYATRELAEAGWNTLKTQYEPLAAISHRIVQGRADIGTVYRLQAVPGDRAAARALCQGMKAAGMSCQVKG
ncbi:SPOR domain-containing protein [Novosphingobium panipatense]|jgi:hypothetical protein|uniref:SPOR domain-containing protein n=1 Tax=Novosphingobium TaxID=165696 RepID=UPI000CDA4141|nr:SPOR domain-containing protein [Novosphingobium sp. HII-3]